VQHLVEDGQQDRGQAAHPRLRYAEAGGLVLLTLYCFEPWGKRRAGRWRCMSAACCTGCG
jgi:hypothetical protein